MKKHSYYSIIGLCLVAMTCSSCATIFSKKQTVTVTSDVDGASVYKGKKYVGKTPLTFQTKAAKQTFTVTKEGYEPQKIYTSVDIRWNTLWNWFNCWTGWFVDIATGSTQKYRETNYFVSLKDPSINEVHNSRQETRNYKNMTVEDAAGILLTTAANTAAQIEAGKAQRKAEEAIKKEMELAEHQARVAQNKAKYAEFQAMTNRSAANTSTYQVQPTNKSQGSYNDLLTSDAAWNTQVQMWVQQYGVEKTREMVNQKRASDYQQSVQSYKNNSNMQSNNERIISAITSNRRQFYIKVKAYSIVAYSEGLNQIGEHDWKNIIPVNYVKTGVGTPYTGDITREFKYTARINKIQIYFNL